MAHAPSLASCRRGSNGVAGTFSPCCQRRFDHQIPVRCLGGISSSVSSVAGKPPPPPSTTPWPVAPSAPGAGCSGRVLPAQPSGPEPAGLLQPLTGAATGTVDYVIEAVPVVNQIVPSGTVGTVTAPVVAAADTIVAEAAHAVLPAASDALPVLEPVLEPVDELMSGTDTLPLHLPGSEALAPGLAAVTDSSAFDGGFGTEARASPGRAVGRCPASVPGCR